MVSSHGIRRHSSAIQSQRHETETGSASSQVIFERERSEELTLGHFLGFSLSKNSTVDTNTTDIESVGFQIGTYFVRNMTEDLFVDGYVAASLLTNNMEVNDKLYDS